MAPFCYYFLAQSSHLTVCWHCLSQRSLNDLMRDPTTQGDDVSVYTHTHTERVAAFDSCLMTWPTLWACLASDLYHWSMCAAVNRDALWAVTSVYRFQMQRLGLKIPLKQWMWMKKILKTKHFLDVCIWCVQSGVWFWVSVAAGLHFSLVWVSLVFGCVECLEMGWHADVFCTAGPWNKSWLKSW